MPERIRCKKCDAVIYEDVDLMAPYEIARRYDGRCPKCGGKLSSTPTNFRVWKD